MFPDIVDNKKCSQQLLWVKSEHFIYVLQMVPGNVQTFWHTFLASFAYKDWKNVCVIIVTIKTKGQKNFMQK